MDAIDKGAYSVCLCEYCGNDVMVSEVNVPRAVQLGIVDLHISDKRLFGCCGNCLTVVASVYDCIVEFRMDDEEGGNVYGFADGVMRSATVNLVDIRQGITDRRWLVQGGQK